MKLHPEETLLQGTWFFDKGEVKADLINKRIEWLISNCLTEVGVDESGWNRLFKDNEDGRYWELTYTEGEMQGGGPLRLENISFEDASAKYDLKGGN